MKTLTRLCLVFVMVAITATAVHAGRPQCASLTEPPTDGRLCFYDLAPYGMTWVTRCDRDSSGEFYTCAIYSWVTGNNDFWQARPDGSFHINLTDAAADIVVCPGPGGYACVVEYFSNNPGFPAPLPGMYAGKGILTAMGVVSWEGFFLCPVVAQGIGTVSDGTVTYAFRDNLIQTRIPGRAEGCLEPINDISVTPKK